MLFFSLSLNFWVRAFETSSHGITSKCSKLPKFLSLWRAYPKEHAFFRHNLMSLATENKATADNTLNAEPHSDFVLSAFAGVVILKFLILLVEANPTKF